jgi:HEAT repeat associated with sister chromatid cohesion
MMKDPNPRKTSTRKGRTQPSKATSNRNPSSIDETAPLQDGVPLSRTKSTDQSDLWMLLVPMCNEYQKYCIDRAVKGALDEQSVVDEALYRSTFSEMMQFRSGLLQKLLTSVHMNDLTSELNLVTISKDGKEHNSSVAGMESNRLNVLCGCFTQAMDCAIASLLTQDVTTSNKGSSSTASASLSMSGSVACLSIFELVAWVSIQLVILQDKDISPPKLRDVPCSLGSGCYQKICLPVLSHICKFAECSVDAIRVVAVRTLCSMAECLGSSSSLDSPVQDWLDVLDTIQQALLPRFTDKAVSVRCAVVQACFPSGFRSFCPDNPLRTDPDILQALQWIVQHDPSPNNRMIAIQHAPFDRTTMEYIIPRMRDTKISVRTAVVAAVSNAILRSTTDPTDFLLPSRHIEEMVTSGYTDR